MEEKISDVDFVGLTSQVVESYVAHNRLSVSELPKLIASVHQALIQVGVPSQADAVAENKAPATSIRKSIRPDYLICLEDGKKFKSLKRHLRTTYGLSPEEYRAKWGLPSDYPMVAPDYAAKRSALAKSMGLGLQRRKHAAAGRPRKLKAAS